MRRRALLAVFGGTLPVTLAGCLGDDDEEEKAREDDETEPEADESTPDESEPTDEEEGDEPDDDEDETGEEEEADTEELVADEEVVVTADSFEPAFVTVDRGAVVAWTSDDEPQSVSFYHQDNGTQTRVPIETEALDETVIAEEPVSFEFLQEGVYDYCHSEYEADGTVGSIVVGDVPDTTQPGLSTPSEDLPENARTVLRERNKQAADYLGVSLRESPVRDADIELLDGAFEPPLLQVAAGGTVTWSATDADYNIAFYHEDVPVELEPTEDEEDENKDEEPETEPRQHRVPDGAQAFSTELLEGEQITLELEQEGIYDYYCQQNESGGMVGSLVVGETDDREQPGLQPPDETIPDKAAEKLSSLHERTVVGFVTDQVNQVLTALNHQEGQSISVLNSYIESEDTVDYLVPVTAESFEEASEEAERLRRVSEEMRDNILHVVPQEVNRQLPIPPIFSSEDIETPDDAREEAERLEEEEASEVYGEAPQRLQEAADFTEALVTQLLQLADDLDAVGET